MGALIHTTQSGSGLSSSSSSQRLRGRGPPTTVEGVVTEIIRVFVDAAPHVPEHRRLPLFSHLLTTVGPSEYLHVALGILTEKYVIQTAIKDQVVVCHVILIQECFVSL